jgi:hypothetical protein
LIEAVLPLDVLEQEIFRNVDEFTGFSFVWVCRYFSHISRNPYVYLPFFDIITEACRVGNLSLLKFWYEDDRRPHSIEFCKTAAYFGQIGPLFLNLDLS